MRYADYICNFQSVPDMNRLPSIWILLSVFLLTGSGNPGQEKMGRKGNVPVDPPFLRESDPWVDSVFASLSEEERIAQMLMIAAYSNRGEDHLEHLKKTIVKYKPGGVIMFQGTPSRQLKMVRELQSVSKIPLLMAQDAEWGLGMRLDSIPDFPHQLSLGAIEDDSLIFSMGRFIGRQLKRTGIHFNFAPVVDVNTNPRNPVINYRSFGENPERVAAKGIAYFKGLQSEHVLSAAKHFPGHGDTDTDSHYALPLIRHNRQHLDSTELLPFREAIEHGITGIMVAHLNVSALDSTPFLASSLSRKIVTGLLQEEMGFKGLITTDAMNMRGVGNHHKPGDAEALAARAGNDIILMPSDISRTIHSIKRAIRRGEISMEEINRRCKKILRTKKWIGLDSMILPPVKGLYRDLLSPEEKLLQVRLAEASLTLLENKNEIIPFTDLAGQNYYALSIGTDSLNEFRKYLELYTAIEGQSIPHFMADSFDIRFKGLEKPIDRLIVSLHAHSMSHAGHFGIPAASWALVDRLNQRYHVSLVIFGNPYCLDDLTRYPYPEALLMAYQDNVYSQRMAAQALFGGFPVNGKMPVSAGKYREGSGMNTEGYFRLRYSVPEDVDMESGMLNKIDSLAQDAIEQRAMPGCQVLVARNNAVVYHKTFGHHSYGSLREVRWDDLYDIASITKIVATVPTIMQFVDKGLIDVEDSLKTYLPVTDTSEKGDLVLKDILAHRAGLQAWIPFYRSTLHPIIPGEPLLAKRFSDSHPIKLGAHSYLNRNISFKPDAFRGEYSPEYPVKVAEDIYLNRQYRDSIMITILRSELKENGNYRYSDLGYYLFQRMIEDMTGKSLYHYVYHNFYIPLGMNLTGYLPLNRFPKSRIIPTEHDIYWRKQLLQGYVHDPGAAMLGGVAGHAGVFSNANDLAKIMQMYLNGGSYGKQQYIREETLEYFNTCHFEEEDNRRGLGFDKPQLNGEEPGPVCDRASPVSFGHAGFTGTIAWADPATGLIYVFLSNRLFPDQFNQKLVEMDVRTNIQEVIYQSLTD